MGERQSDKERGIERRERETETERQRSLEGYSPPGHRESDMTE